MAAKFDIEVKPDGRVAIDTGDLSGAHHASADDFMKELQRLLGGKVEVKSKKGIHSHHHGAHKHVHADGTAHEH